MRPLIPIIIAVIAAATGCGGRPAPAAGPMIPDAALARQALDSALRSWVAGEPKAPALGSVRVEHVDRRRAEGRHPTTYAVAGTVREDWARGFVVRLTWPDEPEVETVTYLVAGIDPIWVLRREEIDLLMHWEHPMEEPEAPPTAAHHPDEPTNP